MFVKTNTYAIIFLMLKDFLTKNRRFAFIVILIPFFLVVSSLIIYSYKNKVLFFQEKLGNSNNLDYLGKQFDYEEGTKDLLLQKGFAVATDVKGFIPLIYGTLIKMNANSIEIEAKSGEIYQVYPTDPVVFANYLIGAGNQMSREELKSSLLLQDTLLIKQISVEDNNITAHEVILYDR